MLSTEMKSSIFSPQRKGFIRLKWYSSMDWPILFLN